MREDGLHTIIDPGADRPIAEIPTLKCVHCGAHVDAFDVATGRKTELGFCMQCGGATCSPQCDKHCVPEEQLLENIEAGRPRDHRPAMVSVPLDLLDPG